MKSKRIYRLVIGIIITLFLGLIYAWSLFVAPIEDDLGITRADTAMTFTISISFFSLANLCGGYLLNKLSPRYLMVTGSLFLLCGFTICSRINTLGGIFFSYGILLSFGVGLCYITTVNTVTQWYSDRVGIASGFLMMGFGLGSLVLGGIATVLFELVGWRIAFLVLGIVFATITFLGSIFMTFPNESQLPPDTSSRSGLLCTSPNLTLSETLHRPSFWIFFCWGALLMAAGLSTINNAATFATFLHATTSQTVLAIGAVSVSNGFGRIFFGALFDNKGRRLAMLVDSTLFIVAMALLTVASFLHSLPVMFCGYVCAGFSFGGLPTLASAYTSSFYGRKNYSLNFAIISLNMIPGALVGPPLTAHFAQVSGSYTGAFLTLLITSFIALVTGELIKRP